LQKEKTILVFADWFVPAYKAGGPIRSCLHFVQQMKDKYRLAILTTDRDLNATEPFKDVVVDRWISFDEGIEIFYCSPQQLSWKFILQQIRKLDPDFIYVNSMYSRYFSVYPVLMRRLGFIRQPIILSPRGMLKDSALQFRKSKKKLFLSTLRTFGIPKLIRFHATDPTEQQDIRRQFGNQVNITLAPNFAGSIPAYPGSTAKKEGHLSIIFVGRIHPIKNLDYLLQLLPAVSGNLQLTIVGSEEDKNYAARCKNLIAEYPKHIEVRFTGEIPNNELPELMKQHHIFALPTRGENFGHAIFEALAVGKPVLISDQTPWRNLAAKKAGWDIDLQKQDQFVQALQAAAGFDQQQYDEWSKAAWEHAAQFAKQPEVKELYYNLFR
jgi:glycosyltransferase involved in cell wall biosynthesis